MSMTSETGFELRQVTEAEWIIQDHRYDAHDARCTIACIWQVGTDECEVTWLRDFSLPMRYRSPVEVLEDLRATLRRSTKPVPIAHFAPGVPRDHEEPSPR